MPKDRLNATVEEEKESNSVLEAQKQDQNLNLGDELVGVSPAVKIATAAKMTAFEDFNHRQTRQQLPANPLNFYTQSNQMMSSSDYRDELTHARRAPIRFSRGPDFNNLARF